MVGAPHKEKYMTPDVLWSIGICVFCCILLIHKNRSLKKLLLIGALLLILSAHVQGTI